MVSGLGWDNNRVREFLFLLLFVVIVVLIAACFLKAFEHLRWLSIGRLGVLQVSNDVTKSKHRPWAEGCGRDSREN
jgi:hypothetical protein